MPYQMLMQKVMHTYSLADAALLPRRDDPEEKGKIVEKGFRKILGFMLQKAIRRYE